jgi:predicted RNA-binding protein with PUA-like domain
MAKHWIFVSVPYTDFNTGSINEMRSKIESSKKWPIGKKTIHRNALSKGDKVLFYQGGEQGRKIVGMCELSSGLVEDSDRMCDCVMIENYEFWKEPVDIRKVLGRLSFVKDSKRWGIYFKGGIVKISKKDYDKILRYHCMKQ